jgi:hypothetical protein
VWWKLNCHPNKDDKLKDNFMPPTLYEMFLEYATKKEASGQKLTADEQELVKKLKDKKFKVTVPIWLRP